MQLTSSQGLVNRMVFYSCSLYVGQLLQGQHYTELRLAYTICLLDDVLWIEERESHHRFPFEDSRTGRVLSETIEVHFLELPKYSTNVMELAVATAIESWVYLLRHAQDYSIEELRTLFPSQEYRSVINTVEEIQMKTEYRELYDSRQKAKLDEAWRLAAAEKKGRQEDIEIGEQRGKLIGSVQIYEGMLGEPILPDELLCKKSVEDLTAIVIQLQKRLHDRAS